MNAMTKKGELLYPMLVIAAIAVIVFSATGIATMMGWMPSALSGKEPVAATAGETARSDASAPRPAAIAPVPGPAAAEAPAPAAAAPCARCGVIESVRAVQVPGQSSWLGAAGGAVVGGLLGNQVGRGGGRTAATVVGAGAGAYAGNEIEKNMNKSTRYQVRVRMDDGTLRTFHEAAQPAYAIGQKVRVTDRGMVAAG